MEYLEDFCDVWPETHQIIHEHKFHDQSPTSVSIFSLVFHRSFIHLPEDQELIREVIDEDGLLDLDSLIETTEDNQTFEVERNRLIDNNTSVQTIEAILSSMNVPCRPFFVEKILNSAREMASDRVYKNYSVLRMHVRMSAIAAGDDDDEEEASQAETKTMVGLSKSVMKKLEMVQVKNQNSLCWCSCSICLEEFFWGLRVIKMPCSHVFHRQCIMNWLKKSKLCPLCRFQMK